MGHEIDLSYFDIRCDLISDTLENKKIKEIKIKKKNHKSIKIEEVVINSSVSKEINKKPGIYTTIYFEDITDYSNRNEVINVLSNELKKILKRKKLINKKVLVVGLGNSLSTPDALGPKTIENIIVTRHLFNLKEVDVEEGFSNVSVFTPGVYASTGIESFDSLKGIINETHPDYIIVIDSLAASSIEKINKIIQITDSGIEPGSGIGNNRKEISLNSLNIPVIAIGIPTVVDAATIVKDTINFLIEKISYNIVNLNNPKEKLINPNLINYLNNGYNLDKEEKKKYLGLLGDLDDEEIKSLFLEVLSPIGYNFMVTPKEVDFLIDKLSIILSKSINKVLHSNLNINNN
ncbi:MAG: GPR endopeptidase [Bacilli bacterium]|nr:GPR endopeptidase [Bacilli bacterium]